MKKLYLLLLLLAGIVPASYATWCVKGTFNNWTADEGNEASITLSLAANTDYEFKIYVDGTAYGYGTNGTYKEFTATKEEDIYSGNQANLKLHTNVAGNYTFSTSYDNTRKVKVEFPENYYLAGTWTNTAWAVNDDVKFVDNKVTIHLDANQTYQFKFFNAKSNSWSGNSGTMKATNSTAWQFTENVNAGITTLLEGDYTFHLTWNESNPVITAEYPYVYIWNFESQNKGSLQSGTTYTYQSLYGNKTLSYKAGSSDKIEENSANISVEGVSLSYSKQLYMNGDNSITSRALSFKGIYGNGYLIVVTGDASTLSSGVTFELKTTSATIANFSSTNSQNSAIKSGLISGLTANTDYYIVANKKFYVRSVIWIPSETPVAPVVSNIVYADTKGASTSELPQTYTEGVGVESFAALEDVEGFHFTGWSPASISTTAIGEQTITAQWEEVEEDETIGEAYKADALADDAACNYDGTLFKMVCSTAKVATDKSSATSADGLTFTKAFLPSGSTTATNNTYSLTAKKKLSKIEVYYTCTNSEFAGKDQSKSGNLIYQIGNADAVTSTTNVDKSNKTAYKEVIAPQGGIDINTVVKIYSSANRLAIFSVVAYEYHELTLVAQNTAGYWATFSSDKAVEFEDATVYTVTANGSNIELQEVTSKQVPANTGVLLKSSSTSATYNYINSADALEGNMLHPASEAMTGSYTFYKLAYNDYQNKTDLGFYYGAEGGAAFTCKAGTAYLAVPVTSAPARTRFVLDQTGTATDVEAVEAQEEVVKFFENGQLLIKKNGVVYNVMGQVVR